MIRPAALVLALAATGTLAASVSRPDSNAVDGPNKGGVFNGYPSFPNFPPYGYAAGFQQGNFGFPGVTPFQAPFMPFPPAPQAAFNFNSVFNAYINALQQYTENLQKLQQQFQQTQAAIASRYAKDADESNPGPSYFVGAATGASNGGPGQISVSAPPGSVVQHFEGPGGLQGVAVTTSGNGFQGFAGGASFGGAPFSAGSFGGSSSSSAGGAPFSAGSFGGSSSSVGGAPFAAESFGGSVGGAPFAAGTFGSGGGNGASGVFTSSSSGVSTVNGQTESFHQSTTGHVAPNGEVSSITVSKP